MAEPFFSVVIPTYNRAEFVVPAIHSVLSQTFSDFEVVVVDDGSKDNTEEVVAAITDSRIRYFKKSNAERAAARNFGIRVSNGRYVNFLDSDDAQYPHHLQAAHDFIRQNEVEIFHLGYDVKLPDGRILRTLDRINLINQRILSGNLLSCNGVVARKDILLQHPFNETRELSSLEDWELWIRLGARYNIHSVNSVTSTVIDHAQRSVVTGQDSAIEKKVRLLIQLVTGDPANRAHYGNKLKQVVASAHTYAALHLRMANAPRSASRQHLWNGIQASPGILFTRRTFVILLMLLGIK